VTITVVQTACYVYGVHDAGYADTQFFTYDTVSGLTSALGPLQAGQDIEGLDIHPTTGVLYGSSGTNNAFGKRGSLYTVDKLTGALTRIGYSGFNDLASLSFRPTDATLWGWAKGKGLIKLNVATGQGTLMLASFKSVDGLAWNNAGTLLYAIAGEYLYAYNPSTGNLTLVAEIDDLPGNAEGLEFRPDGVLMIGVHGSTAIRAYDVVAKQLLPAENITTPYNDVEGLAWPASCAP
jgi:hypothetical protein